MNKPKDFHSRIICRINSGAELTDFYADALRGLGKQPRVLRDIYGGAMSRFANPVNLKRLVNLIDEIEWLRIRPERF